MSKRADPRVAEADGLVQLRGAPIDPERAVALYQQAASAGDPVAMLRSSVMAAGGLGRSKDWDVALDWLVKAAEIGLDDAQTQLQLLAGARGDDWRSLRRGIDLAALTAPEPLRRLSQRSMVAVSNGFAPPAFCARLTSRAAARLEPSRVDAWGTGQEEVSGLRTATTAFFGPSERDLILSVLQERAARLCGLAVSHHEPPSVISYEPGQHYAAHHDYVPLDVLANESQYKVLGQRSVTVVTYLNCDFVGAATQFPALGIEYRGGIGDALVFSNVRSDGTPDPDTLHAGLPPASGRKWVLSQWIRSKPQPIR